ncbi:MAG: iron ABC transporter permease [Anaerolineae bacterium]|nr:iron ABC transporter permease [Anaerolineae bacterium]
MSTGTYERLQTAARLVARRVNFKYGLLLALPIPFFLFGLAAGRYPIPLDEVIRTLLSPLAPGIAADVPEVAQTLVLRLRLPRALAGLFIGASLASTGAAFQGLFKNPLVDSNILGVTSGAGFGAALMLLLTGQLWHAQIAAFGFGLLAVTLAFWGSRIYKTSPMIVLTLMGILIGSFFASLTSLLKYIADPLDALPAITFWLLGGLTAVTWVDIPPLAVITLAGAAFLYLIRWQINILSLGDAEAQALGVSTDRLKLGIIVCCTLMTAIAVSVGGVIGWVGLVIPHAGRIVVGPDHKRLIPISLSFGAAFMLAIDNISRTLLPSEVPLGVITGLVGVPLLVALLRRSRVGW